MSGFSESYYSMDEREKTAWGLLFLVSGIALLLGGILFTEDNFDSKVVIKEVPKEIVKKIIVEVPKEVVKKEKVYVKDVKLITELAKIKKELIQSQKKWAAMAREATMLEGSLKGKRSVNPNYPLMPPMP